ncbi:hypothetical protein CDL12_25693 [Handroanthus impetiginosus]|uniref:BAR domain-containing protein n=1 Tax=Handroanthus impetiginosus TaxID=429701 RepID=A0A2G9G946_9LAMI|nr:hypothetical protein CDL12_25693 [Handroanthus impetiginosus]
MKSPLGKLRKLGLHKSEPDEDWDHHVSVHIDGLTQAAKDMKDMRTCYDGLLSAAAATANSAYEFSESLLEMGNCLLEKTSMHADGESGEALLLLGRLQLELQKLVDSYRSHIIMTITNPSESLLSELRTVEEMKLQCDEKREMFEYTVGQLREKGKSRHGKREAFTSDQLQAVREEYDEAARLCVFRVESLKQGQCRSLLTQAARHHSAQLNFFRKGLQSLEAVEPHIRNVAEKHHIDYELCELNDGEGGDNEGNGSETNEEGELSFDYSLNKKEVDNTSTSRNSAELDQLGAPSSQTSKMKTVEVQINIGRNQGDPIPSQQRRAGSHSAPLYAEKFDPAERIGEMRMSVQKYNRHVLPTPDDAKGSITSSTPLSSATVPGGSSKNLWHSSPLDIEKQKKFVDDRLAAQNFSKSQISAEENSTKHFLPLPRPVTEGAPVLQFDTQGGSDSQKIKRQAFSGPLATKPSSNKPLVATSGRINSTEAPGSLSRVSGPHLPSSLNVSHNAPPPLVSSPKISELHELPRPPDSFGSRPMRSGGALGHSAPLVNRNREISPTNRNPLSSKEGPSLPLPKLTVSRSFSIPSSRKRARALQSGKLLESSQIVQKTEEAPSLPLTPISLSNMKSPKSGQIRVDAGGS